jgi:hypothetical protein
MPDGRRRQQGRITVSRFANARFSNARFATVLAVTLALLVSGVVAGAAGQALIIGAANDAGTSNTSLDTTSSGFAWQMFQHGTGVGVFAISENGVALAGLAHNGNQHALSVTNDGAAGTGAALIADGKNNTAADLRVNSNSIPPLKVNSTAKVANLNADLLDGLNSAGYNYNNNGDPNALIALTASGVSMASVTLEAPAAGHAWVTGKVGIFITHTNGTFDNVICKLSKTSGDVGTPSFGIGFVRIPAAYPTASAASVDTVEVTRVFSVAAGANTFHLNCFESSSILNASIIQPEIASMFVPTRYGTGPAPASVGPRGGVDHATD